MIQRAQQDSEQLLKDSEKDPSLFDISNQLVYGGMYGPTFGSLDTIGCGIMKAGNESAVFFSHNGLELPGIRYNGRELQAFPIVSMKGKLCHIELIKSKSLEK